MAGSSMPTPSLELVPPAAADRLSIFVRAALIVFALALTGVFGIAAWLNPYEADGTPRKQATHRQLGLPPCTFYEKTGIPCPSCGFTTSFAFTVRMRLWNALNANCVGTLLALFCLAFVPWGLVSALRGRYLFVASLEKAAINCLIVFVALMLVRWGIIVGLAVAK
ncbi:MAG: DUF2752 domain-containing protein [Gemmataceae bacterium]